MPAAVSGPTGTPLKNATPIIEPRIIPITIWGLVDIKSVPLPDNMTVTAPAIRAAIAEGFLMASLTSFEVISQLQRGL